ncbi:MAG: protein phosphatase 2C domain-containing protein [Candidatus Azobacteroides sp.]|nr:protein phosphatase 2C domain-containing protein [Candidatus Azobacteroides sp.]
MSILIKMAAWCDQAGRPNNEDNFLLNKNISNHDWSFTANETIPLDEKGALLVVCDGMGGMNAGEVASAIAVDTVKDRFLPEKLTKEITGTPDAIFQYVKKTIAAADAKIKKEADNDKEKEGMGSTIVLAWLIGKNAYIGWCGDSRAYRFNPVSGLERLTRDHSYVQELIDAGKLAPEMALGHPQNNIITRSLGDSGKELRPDTVCISLYNNDVILLCSDGLCGIMSDKDMENVLMENSGDIKQSLNTLLSESEKIGWIDNVTIALCRIESGAGKATVKNTRKEQSVSRRKFTTMLLSAISAAIILILIAFGSGYFLGEKKNGALHINTTDSIGNKTPVLQDSTNIKKDIERENNDTINKINNKK